MKTNLLILVSRLLHGGIDTLLIEYLKHFDKNKFQITLAIGICMEELEMHIEDIPTDIRIEYLVKNHGLIKYRKKKVIGNLHGALKLYDEAILNPFRRIVQKQNLQKLIRANDAVIDFDSTFYSFLKNCPVNKIAFFHFSFKQYHNGNRSKLKRLGKKMLVYDKIITVCNEMKEEGEELFPEIKEKFTTIYNSFNFDSIKEKASGTLSQEPVRPPYILAIQRLEETQKDTTTLLKAFKILMDKYHLDIQLYIIGEGKNRTQLEELRNESGLIGKIHFPGFEANPYPWINRCELFVLSSKFEGFGNVLVEAMILGKPIVSTDCPTGPKEILANGKAGILTPVGDETKMAEAIFRLLTDSMLKERILTYSRHQVEKFNVEKNIKQIENLILASIK